VHGRLHRWARVLRHRGVAPLTEAITLTEGLPGRMLAVAGGERRLTDLRHVAELLHGAATAEQMGATALTSWLRQRIAMAEAETSDEDRSRRLESDEAAVQVLTVHRSKGLEFPIVYYPSLWEAGRIPRAGEPVAFHDPARGDQRAIDVGLEGPDYAAHRRLNEAEQRGEDLRLAYVALTRARHQAVVYWTGAYNAQHSPLGRLLFSRADDGTVAVQGPSRPPGDAAAHQRFVALADAAPGLRQRRALDPSRAPVTWIAAARAGRRARRRGVRPRPRPALAADVVLRPHRGLTRPARGQRAGGAGRRRRAGRPGPRVAAGDEQEARLRAVPSLLGDMAAGVHVGTFVHRVLEATDFARPDLGAELAGHVAAQQARRHVEIGDSSAVVAGLRAAIETPLGPVLGDLRLRDVARADRLDELDFELPLAGGDTPRGPSVSPRPRSRALLREHLGPADPLAAYADRLGDPALRQAVRGYLTGSIDLVVRLRDAAGGRVVRDRRLQDELARVGEEPLSAWHHRPAVLAAEMRRSHYGLQALLYTVALHRYLRWRIPGYDPGRGLAGVVYLFVRGMTGEGTPVVDGARCGVFAWRPEPALVEALSDLLDRGGRGVTGPRVHEDPFDVRRVRDAPALLRTFNDAGVLAAADVHVARRLARIGGEDDPAVMLAAALAVRGPRLGHVYVDLATIAQTATVDADEPVTSRRFRGPSPGRGPRRWPPAG
jgi:exodeoxyribonuclease V beta subunit